MPKITKIDSQKKRQNRYSVFVDDEYAFALSSNDLLNLGLHSGQEFSQAELQEVKESAGAGRAYDQAINYLSLRRRSKREIVDYLRKKEDYDDGLITRVVEKLELAGFIDDVAFTQAWVNDRNLLKPRSRRQLQQELRQKGLSSDVIEIVLSSIDESAELELAIKIAQKKLTRISDQQKLIAYLMRQGFSYSIAKQALELTS